MEEVSCAETFSNEKLNSCHFLANLKKKDKRSKKFECLGHMKSLRPSEATLSFFLEVVDDTLEMPFKVTFPKEKDF